MHFMEKNLLVSILQMRYFIDLLKDSYPYKYYDREDFEKKHPALVGIKTSLQHIAIISARRLYETELREGLNEEEWKTISDLRHSVAHSKKEEDRIYRILINDDELDKVLNKIFDYIYDKYNLHNDYLWQRAIKKHIRDLKVLKIEVK